jgi:hypothetical protein
MCRIDDPVDLLGKWHLGQPVTRSSTSQHQGQGDRATLVGCR